MSTNSFKNINISKEMVENLAKLGYVDMSPIQSESLPHILEGKDVIAQAKTGSGKTASFGIGMLHNLDVKRFRVQGLILCPTRELADQVSKELRNIAKFAHNIKILTLVGGSSFGMQLGSLKHQAHIIVGTPGRVLKHLNKESLNLEELKTLVLDEADRMLDMGFIEEIEGILAFAPQKRQTLLFSATYDSEITKISKKIQTDAINIKTTSTEKANNIIERFYNTSNKIESTIAILSTSKVENVIIFTNTKLEAKEVADRLQENKIDALAIHGDLEQYERNDVLVQFSNKSCRVLVATDVAARGLDIKELSMVLNYDLPHSSETYTHRIGRTGRAGEDGIAVTLYDSYEMDKIDEDYRDEKKEFLDANDVVKTAGFEMKPKYITLVIEGGKKDKLRAGDILGALTGDGGLDGKSIGKIELYERQAYVAIESKLINQAEKKLSNSKIKAKKFAVWVL